MNVPTRHRNRYRADSFSVPRLPVASVLLAVVLVSSVPEPARAADAGTGAVRGVVVNPVTGAYVAHAEVRVEGTSLATVTDRQGAFTLDSVPAGPATLAVTYTGYTTARDDVVVVPGQAVAREIRMTSALGGPAAENGTVKLQQFVVAGAREGSAKAIMEQRQAQNITNSVAADSFGDIAEGNVGEFLKHLPGVELDLTQGEIRTVRLRGLDSQYAGVTLDGNNLANADASATTGATARSFSFEQVSLSSLDSIEVSKTISADVDANAPAGTINLKTKRAFDRAGRRISWATNLTASSQEFHFDRSYGPDERRRFKIRPGASLDYSDIFLDRRLGLTLAASESNVYNDYSRTTMAYNTTTTAADPRPVVPTSITFLQSTRTNRRATYSLTADYKATPGLILSLTAIHNYAELTNYQRSYGFTSGARAAVAGADPLVSFTSAPAGSVSSSPAGFDKMGRTVTLGPKFEYKRNNLLIEGSYLYSYSKSWYDGAGGESVYQLPTSVAGVQFRAERSSPLAADWQIRQLAGPDIANGANFTTGNAGRIVTKAALWADTELETAALTAQLTTKRVLPVVWKTGVKTKLESRKYHRPQEQYYYSYIGPGAGVGEWAAYPSPVPVDLRPAGAGIAPLTPGGSLFMPNLVAIAALRRERPQDFVQSMTPAGYFNQDISSRTTYKEDIDAVFAMATALVGKARIRVGARNETTSTDALDYNPRSRQEVLAAGFAVDATGRATTIPGIDYQYLSKPRVHRKGKYDHFFPNASLKYSFNRNLDFQFGYSKTIRRPTLGNVSGVWRVDDVNLRVTAPNAGLLPELSDNLSSRLAYYFEPVGLFALNAFQNDVRGLHQTNELTAAEFGYSGAEDLSGYTFVTTAQSADKVVVRGLELEYSQSLSFLPQPFDGLNVRASYTRSYAQVVWPNMAPHLVSAGISYTNYRWSAYVNANWSDTKPTNTLGTADLRHRFNADIGGSVRLFGRVRAYFNARNLLNDPMIIYANRSGEIGRAGRYDVNGLNYTFGLKGDL